MLLGDGGAGGAPAPSPADRPARHQGTRCRPSGRRPRRHPACKSVPASEAPRSVRAGRRDDVTYPSPPPSPSHFCGAGRPARRVGRPAVLSPLRASCTSAGRLRHRPLAAIAGEPTAAGSPGAALRPQTTAADGSLRQPRMGGRGVRGADAAGGFKEPWGGTVGGGTLGAGYAASTKGAGPTAARLGRAQGREGGRPPPLPDAVDRAGAGEWPRRPVSSGAGPQSRQAARPPATAPVLPTAVRSVPKGTRAGRGARTTAHTGTGRRRSRHGIAAQSEGRLCTTGVNARSLQSRDRHRGAVLGRKLPMPAARAAALRMRWELQQPLSLHTIYRFYVGRFPEKRANAALTLFSLDKYRVGLVKRFRNG